jgi:GNAT superfamily N-acetyltransferase
MPVQVSDELGRLRDRYTAAVRSVQSEAAWPADGIETADDPSIVACTTVVTVRDGTRVRIRPIVIADRTGLAHGFERLSPQSRARRFVIPPSALSESMQRYFTEIDYTNHMALGAFAVDDPGQPGVAVARYVRLRDDPACAEVAITVLDDYQHRGIGTMLLEALGMIALRNGITQFCGFVQWDNSDALELARASGAAVHLSDPGLARIDVPLTTSADRPGESALRSALRALATRELAAVASPLRPRPDQYRGTPGETARLRSSKR